MGPCENMKCEFVDGTNLDSKNLEYKKLEFEIFISKILENHIINSMFYCLNYLGLPIVLFIITCVLDFTDFNIGL